ncbi:15406_t:CDS:1, partial [Racocetra fulgida]
MKVGEIDKGNDDKVKKDDTFNKIDKVEIDGNVYGEDYGDYEKEYGDIDEAVEGKDDQNDDIYDENPSDYEEYCDYEDGYDDVNEVHNDHEEEFRYDSYEFILGFLNRYGDYVSEIDIKNKFMEADKIIKTSATVTTIT